MLRGFKNRLNKFYRIRLKLDEERIYTKKSREEVILSYHSHALNRKACGPTIISKKTDKKSNTYTPLIAVHLLVENRSKSWTYTPSKKVTKPREKVIPPYHLRTLI